MLVVKENNKKSMVQTYYADSATSTMKPKNTSYKSAPK